MSKDEVEMNSPEAVVPGRYQCGTLNYTLRSLAAVFIWIMIGGMTLSLFTQIPAMMLPVKLKLLEANGFQTSLILSFIGSTLNFIVCPIVGFKSDRYRSKWGRRIPFILMSLPFISLSLILFGFSEPIGAWLSAATGRFAEITPITMTITVIALVMFMFQFANMYVNSVFWYIFNDVIPPQFFGRIMGAFQVASAAGVAAFNFFIFKYAAPWYTEIFVTAGILYAIGMGLMCIMVKEGEYPPILGEEEKKEKNWFATFWLFCKESCCCRFYILRYTLTTVFAISGGAGFFTYYYYLEMGLDNGLIGKLNGTAGIVMFLATLGVTALVGFLIDRWHPMRIYIYGLVFGVAASAFNWKWLFGVLPGETFVWVGIFSTVGGAVLAVVCNIASLPMEMLTFPKSRFGSFCSAQALIRALICTGFSLIIGVLFDGLKVWFPISPTFYYRFVPIWPLVWSIPTAVVAYITYREWGRLGGYKHYRAPACWSPDGSEPVTQPETTPPSAGLLQLAIHCFDAFLLIGLAITALLSSWAGHTGMPVLARNLLVWALPCQAGVLVLWYWVRRGIFRDIDRALRGEAPHNGIPHHGLLLLVALRQVFFLGVDTYQVIVIGEAGGFAFMMADIFTNLVLVVSIYAVARMERGIVTEVTPSGSFRDWMWYTSDKVRQFGRHWKEAR